MFFRIIEIQLSLQHFDSFMKCYNIILYMTGIGHFLYWLKKLASLIWSILFIPFVKNSCITHYFIEFFNFSRFNLRNLKIILCFSSSRLYCFNFIIKLFFQLMLLTFSHTFMDISWFIFIEIRVRLALFYLNFLLSLIYTLFLYSFNIQFYLSHVLIEHQGLIL